MILAGTVRKAIAVHRRTGWSGLSRIARSRAATYLTANGIVPAGVTRRMALLSAMLNAGAEFAPVCIDRVDAEQVRASLLFPYARRQFPAVAGAAALADLTPVEIAVVADCLWRMWDFATLVERLPGWTAASAGTKFARRIGQVSRRVALRTGRLREAAAGLDAEERDASGWLLRGEILDATGALDEAGLAFEAAAGRHAYDPLIRLNHAFHLLKRGRLADGVVSWGLADRILGTYPLRATRPQWTGEALGDRTLLVVFQHGLGDMIQFTRFLIPLRQRHPAVRIVACVAAVLRTFLARSFPDVRFVPAEERDPPFDVFIPVILLPAVLGLTDPEPRPPYLSLPDPAPLPRAPGPPRPRVGVCWRGHPRHYELTRSVPLASFSRLFADLGLEFVVLLNAPTPAETALLASFPNVRSPPIRDFLDLGAVVAACDLVVSVDTAVVHVAAGAERPVLLLSRPDSCWRWGPDDGVSAWYPGVEVLRHHGDLDWPAVLAAAARRLDRLHEPQALSAVSA